MIVLLSIGEVAAAQTGEIGRGAAPAFVAHAQLPEPNPKRLRQIEDGTYHLLYDTQVRVEKDLQTTYFRQAYKLLARSALESGAQVSVKFDPSYERVVLHRIAIIRDGRVRDATAASDIDIIRQEEQLGDGILTGTKTILIRLPDVRVGDIVDVSWSWLSKPPLWEGHYFGSFSVDWSVPVGLTRVRLDLPAGTGLTTHRYRGAPGWALRRAGQRDLREWVSVDAEPVVDDEGTPKWHRPWRRVSVSTLPDWKAVVDLTRPLYAAADDFPASLEDEASRIEREGGPPEAKALKALRLIQDSIRYTSVSIGTGSYRPRSPQAVVRSRWGDCKDKAQLLVTLLRRLGIEAWPALTDSDEGAALRREAPSPNAFDHVIVQIRTGGKTFWVDPTMSQQGGTLATQAALPYRWALPIRTGQRALEPIPVSPLQTPDMDVVESYRFGADGIRLGVVTTYTAGEADRARAYYSGSSLAERESEFLAYYAGNLPGLRLGAPVVTRDDRSANQFVVRESYFLPRSAYGDELLDEFPISASALVEVFTYPRGERRHPLGLAFPVRRTHKIEFITPGMSVSPVEEVKLDGKAFSFSLTQDQDGEKTSLLFSLAGKTSLLSPQHFAEFRKDADTLAENASWLMVIGPGPALTQGTEVAIAILFLVAAVLLCAGIVHAWRRREAERDGEQFYPVPASKFLLLGVGTWGIYPYYWFWRHWRWVQRHEDKVIMPFWRAFFGVFWLHPLFSNANQRAAPPVAAWLGVAAAVSFLVWTVGTSIADNVLEAPGWAAVLSFLAVVFALPALVAVNRANSPEQVAANGKWGWLAILAFPVGLATALLIPFLE